MEAVTPIDSNLLATLEVLWNNLHGVMVLCGALLFMLLVQLYYLWFRYTGIVSYRNNRHVKQNMPLPAISVVIPIRENDLYFVESHLEKLLLQEYDDFEVVAVNCSVSEEIADALDMLRFRYPHLRITQVRPDAHFQHSTKLVMTVGIKAATKEHLLFTNTSCYPDSQKWIALMAKGFQTADIVIGYCGMERQTGLANLWMRCSRLALSVRFLSEAIHGRPYRGISGNIGYTRQLYFDNKGFSHLNLHVGDDDLFIQKITKGRHVSVVMNPAATVREIQYGGWRWWADLQRFCTYAFHFYPNRVRCLIGLELWSRGLFFALAVATLVVAPMWIALGVVALVLLRMLIVAVKIHRTGKRLGERGVVWGYLLYDLCAPVSEAFLALDRRIRRNNTVWR